ncbi:MAG: precorrin-8X methylmutase [Anaerovoracaceae bacterium]|jgi:precorrin-8X/cobalt-precorrin-8 methylmutase
MKYVKPAEIEKRSFEIIKSEMKTQPPEDIAPVLMRVIHTTADFDYEDNLVFSDNAVQAASDAFDKGAVIVTDTNMALSGINKGALGKLHLDAMCFMSNIEIAAEAQARGITRAAASMEKAARITGKPLIFAIGNAPTALIRLAELIEDGSVSPALVIGVPVGFVNVIESKERMMKTAENYIIARGRKGGSSVAAAVVNALMYEKLDPQRNK